MLKFNVIIESFVPLNVNYNLFLSFHFTCLIGMNFFLS